MLRIYLVLVAILLSQAKVMACDSMSEDIYGHWKFYKYLYEGKENPPLNPLLNLNFEFYFTGTSRLWWTRDNEKGFCERVAQYEYKDCKLSAEVVWVNPKNNIGCGQDPDMQVGHKTTSQIEIINGDLYLHLSLGGKPFIYIWKKIEPKAPPISNVDVETN